MKGTKVILLILMILVVLTACKKEKTSWNSDWNFPLFNDTLRISDWVNDSTFSENTDNSIQVSLDRQIASVDFFNLVEIPDTFIIHTFTINFSSLLIAPGTQFVNEEEEHQFDLGDVVLSKARFKNGEAQIKIENPIEATVEFQIELPGVTKNGVVFSQTEMVPPKENGNSGSEIFTLDLSGYQIDMTGTDGDSYNTLRSRMTVRSSDDSEETTMTNQDIVIFEVTLRDLVLDYGKGYFGSEVIEEKTDFQIDLLNNITDGNLALSPINMSLFIENGIKAKAQLKVNELKNTNFENNAVALSHPKIGENININPAQGEFGNFTPSVYQLDFTPSNSNLNDFIENLGSNFILDLDVSLNPWGNSSLGNNEIFPESRVKVRLQSDFLLSAGAENLTFIDTFETDFENQEEALRVSQGDLIVKVGNSFPYEGEISIFLLNENHEEILFLDSDNIIAAGSTDDSEGTHSEVESELIFRLPNNVLANLSNLKFIRFKAVLNSSSYPDNIVYSNAELRINAYTNFKLKTEL